MDFALVVRRRHMTRSFSPGELDPQLIQVVLRTALASPSAGNTRGTRFAVLFSEGARQRFWELTTTSDWWERNPRRAGLRRAPVIVLPLVSPLPYLKRYLEPDKAGSGLEDEAAWPQPYWVVDGAFATMSMLLACTNLGLGACFMGIYRGEEELLKFLGEQPSGPDGLSSQDNTVTRALGAILIGHPDGQDPPSRSLGRRTPGNPKSQVNWY
jgi:nitroreductase